MKKAIYPLCIAISTMLAACGNSNSSSNNTIGENDSCSPTVTPHEMVNPDQIGKEKTDIGVTLDRSMNSILILNADGDSLEFDYSDIENRAKIFGSNIGDTVTVKYVTLTGNRDSVTAIYRGQRP